MRRFLAQPLLAQPGALLAVTCLVCVAGVVAFSPLRGRSDPNPAPPPTVASTPSTTLGAQTQTRVGLDVNNPRTVAQAFAFSYVPYLYGQGEVAAIQGASPELMHQLETEMSRPAPAQRERRPRITDLQLQQQGPDVAQAVFQIDDGLDAQYPIRMHLMYQAGQWQVVSLDDQE
jgi:hypothetical protein